MSQRNTLVRSLHDIGLAGWCGGSLSGAVGLNGVTATVKDPKDVFLWLRGEQQRPVAGWMKRMTKS